MHRKFYRSTLPNHDSQLSWFICYTPFILIHERSLYMYESLVITSRYELRPLCCAVMATPKLCAA